MAPVIAYARGDYAADLLKGRSDPEALTRIVDRVTELTGLDKTLVRPARRRRVSRLAPSSGRRTASRVPSGASTITNVHPHLTRSRLPPPSRATTRSSRSIIAPTTTAMVDFVTRVVGWDVSARYHALSYEVNGQWDT